MERRMLVTTQTEDGGCDAMRKEPMLHVMDWTSSMLMRQELQTLCANCDATSVYLQPWLPWFSCAICPQAQPWIARSAARPWIGCHYAFKAVTCSHTKPGHPIVSLAHRVSPPLEGNVFFKIVCSLEKKFWTLGIPKCCCKPVTQVKLICN